MNGGTRKRNGGDDAGVSLAVPRCENVGEATVVDLSADGFPFIPVLGEAHCSRVSFDLDRHVRSGLVAPNVARAEVAPPEERARLLEAFWLDPEIDLLLFARGGEGAAAVVLCDFRHKDADRAALEAFFPAFAASIPCPVFSGFPYGHVPGILALDFRRKLSISPDGLLQFQ